MHSVKYSILIPAFKDVFLEKCLGSILMQTFSDFEVIVVDDASPNHILPVVERFEDSRIHYYRNEKGFGARNVIGNWNKCLEYASGEFVICMGDDDELASDCLAIYNTLMDRYPMLDVYHVRTAIIDEDSSVKRLQETRPPHESVYSAMSGRWQGREQYIGDYLFRTSALKDAGGFYFVPYAWGADDIITYIVGRSKGIANADQVGFKYRENSHSISCDRALAAEKVESALLCRSWYESFLAEKPCNGEDVPTWEGLREGLDGFM